MDLYSINLVREGADGEWEAGTELWLSEDEAIGHDDLDSKEVDPFV